MNRSILSPLEVGPERGVRALVRSSRGVHPLRDEARSALMEMLQIAWWRKWMVLLVAVLVTIPAIVYVYRVSPVYNSSALLLIEQNRNRILSIDDAIGGGLGTREHMLTQIEFLRSRNVLERVIDNLGLETNALFDPRARQPGLIQQASKGLSKWLNLPAAASPAPSASDIRTDVYETVATNLDVQPVKLSQLIRISFESEDPALAAAVANAVAESYIQAEMDARYSMTVQANEWLNEQAQKLRANLAASEKVLQAYRDSKGLIDKQSEAQGGAGRQLEALTQRLVEARVRRSQAEQALAQIRASRGRSLESIPTVSSDLNVNRAREARSRAQLRLAELTERYGEAHPLYQAAAAEAAAADAAVTQAVDAAVAVVSKEFSVARAIENSLVASIEQFQKSIQVQNRDEFELAGYEREVNSNRMLLETFLDKAKEASVATDIRSAAARVVDRAVPAPRPIKPRKSQVIALAFALGTMLGLALVIVRHRLDKSIDGVDAAESAFGHPVLATVPSLSRGKAAHAHQMVGSEPDSSFSEAIRTIRTSVLLFEPGASRQVIVVTSALPDEGKSTISFNLASALSQTRKTLFVECDMRRPRLLKQDMEWNRPGLADVLVGRVPLEECLVPMKAGQLTVLSAGSMLANPLELLSSRTFQELIARLASEFDVVVLDTPPVGVVSDTLVVAEQATGIVFVARARRTPRKLIRRALALLAETPAGMMGIVLNHANLKKSDPYYEGYARQYWGGYSESYSQGSAAPSVSDS